MLNPARRPTGSIDERGLYLEVSPTGGKWWRLKYRFGGKEKRLSLGVYPDVSLKDARDRRERARKLLADGIDPSENRKAQKLANADRAANSFEVVAREWIAKYSADLGREPRRPRHSTSSNATSFRGSAGGQLPKLPHPRYWLLCAEIESRGALDTAHRTLSNCGQVFRYAVATGRATRDPSGDLRGALPRVRGGHFAASTEPKEVA